MFLSLRDNAFDSIQYGLDSYEKFLLLPNKHLEDNPTHLKVAIIMIHNGVELVLKYYLSCLNELIIYDLKEDKKKDLFFKAYATRLSNPETTLEKYFLEQNISIKTIDYSEIIKIFKSIYSPTDKEFWCLKKIGIYRNQVTHYGINLQNDYYGVLQSLHGVLDLILEGTLSDSLERDKWKVLAHKFDGLFINSEQQMIDEWANTHLNTFKIFTSTTQKWLNESSTKDLLVQNNLSITWSPPHNSIDHEFNIRTSNQIDYPFYSIKIPFLNVTFFADDKYWDGPIYFLIDHNIDASTGTPNEQLYIFKEPLKYSNYEYCGINFWKDPAYKNLREVRPFNEVNLSYCLTTVLKKFSQTVKEAQII